MFVPAFPVLGSLPVGHDPLPGGRAARHLGSSLSCVLCNAARVQVKMCSDVCDTTRLRKMCARPGVLSAKQPTTRARDQTCIGRSVSHTLGLTSSWQPMCQGIRAYPPRSLEGEPTKQRISCTQCLHRIAVSCLCHRTSRVCHH